MTEDKVSLLVSTAETLAQYGASYPEYFDRAVRLSHTGDLRRALAEMASNVEVVTAGRRFRPVLDGFGGLRWREIGSEVADTSEPSQGLSEALEERRRKNTPASVPNGSVVRFQRQLSSHRSPYSYAAIWVSEVGKWYLSGSGGMYSHADFLDLLAEDAMHVQYAADWKDI